MVGVKTTILPPQTISDISSGHAIISMIDDLFDEIYLVGGAVRDGMLGRETFDLDFATPCTAVKTLQILQDKGFLTRENAMNFGTVSTHIGKYDIQITSYRTEEYNSSSRNPNVNLATNINSDLARRDFTINAMAVSRKEFIDPYNGVLDLKERVIRTVGQPGEKFIDDPLRLLRAYRLVSIFGLSIETKTLEAIYQNVDQLQKVSGERIAEELRKIIEGEYWSDAFVEAAEAKVLSACFRKFGFSAPVRPSSVNTILEGYTNAEISEMSVPARWVAMFDILSDAEKFEGAKTLDAKSLVNTFAPVLLIKKAMISQIEDIFEKRGGKIIKKVSRIEELEKEYDDLLENNDGRSLIVGSKLYFERGRASFYEHSYRKASEHFMKALQMNDNDINYIIDHFDGEEKERKIRSVKSYYIERYSYYVSCLILVDNLHLRKSGDDTVQFYLRHGQKSILNEREIEQAIVYAIARVYRYTHDGFLNQNYLSFLKKWSHSLPVEQYRYLTNLELRLQLSSGDLTPVERITIYKQQVEFAENQLGTEEKNFSYYDPLLDLKLWQAMSTEDSSSFWKALDQLELATDKYIEYASATGRQQLAYRRAHLNTASALIYGLSLTKSLDLKISIVRKIVASYIMAGYSSSKNALRYKVLLDWLQFVSLLQTGSELTLQKFTSYLENNSRSLGYIDIDEAYFIENLPYIAEARDNLNAVFQCLNSLSGKHSTIIAIDALNAISILSNESLLRASEALVMVKNYCLKQTTEKYERIPFIIDEEDLAEEMTEIEKLSQAGESETAEFKAGWYYSHSRGGKDKEIPVAITRTISAFMNTSGGTILVGVEDNGEIKGLEESDFKLYPDITPLENIDKLKRSIDDHFDNLIGTQFTHFKRVSTEIIKNKTILIISVSAANRPAYLKIGQTESLYVRGSGTTRELTGSSMVAYVADHFN